MLKNEEMSCFLTFECTPCELTQVVCTECYLSHIGCQRNITFMATTFMNTSTPNSEQKSHSFSFCFGYRNETSFDTRLTCRVVKWVGPAQPALARWASTYKWAEGVVPLYSWTTKIELSPISNGLHNPMGRPDPYFKMY